MIWREIIGFAAMIVEPGMDRELRAFVDRARETPARNSSTAPERTDPPRGHMGREPRRTDPAPDRKIGDVIAGAGSFDHLKHRKLRKITQHRIEMPWSRRIVCAPTIFAASYRW